MKAVCFDLETGGLDVERHPIIQIGAVACDLSDCLEIESFERKIVFDVGIADAKSLSLAHYDADVWSREAILLEQALWDFNVFLCSHADIDMVSRAGNPYRIARLLGFNVTFDATRIRRAYEKAGIFFSASYGEMCVLNRARFFFAERSHSPPANFKLGTLADYFGVPHDAHDALSDARATLAVYRAIRGLTA